MEFARLSNILQDNKRQFMVKSIMQIKEWSKVNHNAQLDVGLLQARYVQHAYPRHSHDYYVICLIERGRQSFTHKGTQHLTPAGGVILINPGAVHTGEAVDEQGFEMRSIYPTTSHMQMVAFELTGCGQAVPFFREVRVDDPFVMKSVLSIHKAMSDEADAMERESKFVSMLAQLIKKYADFPFTEQKLGNERKAIHRAKLFIEEYFAQGVSLNLLAQHVALSPYYLLRAFSAEVGMPPHAYLESVRIRNAQRLIEIGHPLTEIALAVGFSSQSHMTNRFKKIIGVTPGQYAGQIHH